MRMKMLEGLRIIEFEGLGPAPFASMLLADLGAEAPALQVLLALHRRLLSSGRLRARYICLGTLLLANQVKRNQSVCLKPERHH